MKKTIFLKMTTDWENYDDVINELIIEDSGVLDSLKEGVSIEEVFSPADILPYFNTYHPQIY